MRSGLHWAQGIRAVRLIGQLAVRTLHIGEPLDNPPPSLPGPLYALHVVGPRSGVEAGVLVQPGEGSIEGEELVVDRVGLFLGTLQPPLQLQRGNTLVKNITEAIIS